MKNKKTLLGGVSLGGAIPKPRPSQKSTSVKPKLGPVPPLAPRGTAKGKGGKKGGY